MKRFFPLLFCFVICIFAPFHVHAQWVNGQPATWVVGQPDFLSNAANNPSTALGLNFADGVAIDVPNGKMYVCDRNNHRVLRYPYPITTNQPTPDATVFGQMDLTGTLANRGLANPTALTLNSPLNIMVESGNLWIVDELNNRVIRFSNAHLAAPDPSADLVIGQANFVTGTLQPLAANSLTSPHGIALDAANGKLYVSDRANNRVLRYNFTLLPAANANAEAVFGQTSFTANAPGTTVSTLSGNTGITVDAGGALYVADATNNRVLRYNSAHLAPVPPAVINADAVYGQPSFVSGAAALAQNRINSPLGITIDISTNDLYVADRNNFRVLVFLNAPGKPATNSNADFVLGQNTFTSNSAITSRTIGQTPRAIAFDATNQRLLVSHSNQHRVLQFDKNLPTLNTASPLLSANNGTPTQTIQPTFSQAMNLLTTTNFKAFGGMTGVEAGTFANGATATPNFTPTAPYFRGEKVEYTITTGATLGDGASSSAGNKPYLNNITGTARATPFVGNYRTSTNAPAGGVNFVLSTFADVGGSVVAIAPADFDGDGVLDFAAAVGAPGNQIAIRRNYGLGNFAFNGAGQTFGIGGGAMNDVKVADVNNDGKPDCFSIAGTTLFMTANTSTPGALSFNLGGQYTTGLGATAVAIATGDFDGDGDIDVAVATTAPNQLRILQNNFPAFTLSFLSSTPLPFAPRTIAAADFNRDGATDIAVGFDAPGNNIRTYHNDGGGQFNQTAVNLAFGSLASSIATGDIDGTLGPDIVVAVTSVAPISIQQFSNDGSGGFGSAVVTNVQNFATTGCSIDIGDIDGNGSLDVVFAKLTGITASGMMGWFTNNGTGALGLTANGSVGVIENNVKTIALADIDQDGDLDAFVGYSAGAPFPYVAVLRNEQAPKPNPPAFNPLINAQNISRTTPIITAFTNPSGNMTTATASLVGPVRIYGNMTAGRNRAGGGSWAGAGTNTVTFTPNSLIGPAAPNRFFPSEIISTSLPAFQANAVRNDRFVPITSGTFTNIGGHVRQFRTQAGAGPANFYEQQTYPISGGLPRAAATGDFNNDGRLDFVVTNEGGTRNYAVFLGGTGGAFTPLAPVNEPSIQGNVVTGDFNNDGNLDIAIACSPDIKVFLGAGAGTFGAPISLPTGGLNYSLCVGDFNGDGFTDVLASSNGSFAQMFLNGGTATFTALTAVSTPNPAFSIKSGDIDRDGDIDAVVANNSGAGVNLTILMNDGQGKMTVGQTFTLGNPVYDVDLGDFNNDGWLDIAAVQNAAGQLLVFLNNQTGPTNFYPAAPNSTLSTPSGTSSVVVGDFNGDNALDLITTNELSNCIIVFTGNNTGAFMQFSGATVGSAPRSWSAAGDFDNDGDLDFVTANWGANTISILINAKPPRINPVVPLGNAASYQREVAPQRNSFTQTAGAFPVQVRFDQAVTTATASFPNVPAPNSVLGAIAIHGSMTGQRSTSGMQGTWNYNAGTNTARYTPPGTNPFRVGETVMVTVTNARANTPDNLVYSTSPTVYAFTVAPTGGTGRFVDARRYATPNLAVSRHVTLGDFDNDGKIDILQGSTLGLNVLRQTGTAPTEFAAGATFLGGSTVYHSVAADFDNDGALDIAVSLAGNTVEIRKNNGSGGFGAVLFTIGALPGIVSRLSTADFDGDGDMDIAMTILSAGPMRVYLNNGNGTSFTQAYSVGTSPTSLVTGDFDNDGDIDIATVDNFNAQIWLNQGAFVGGTTSLFAAPTAPWIYPVASCSELASGDFNGDGYTDLAVSSDVINDITILQNSASGNGQFAAIGTYNTGSPGVMPIVGDFDGDTRLDIAAFKPRVADSKVLLYKGSGAGTFSLASSSPLAETSNNATSVNPLSAAADIDGDGDLDLVLPLDNGRRTAILLNHQPDLKVTSTLPAANAASVAEPITITTLFSQNVTSGTASLPVTLPPASAAGPLRIYGGMTGGRSTLTGGGSWAGVANSATFTPNNVPVIGKRFFPGEKVEFIASTNTRIQAPPGITNTVPMTTGTVRQFWTRAGIGPGTFFQIATPTTAANPTSVTLGDIDGDGDLDAAVGDAGGVTILRNNGTAGFTTFGTWGGAVGGVQFGDVDNDGDLDLAVTNSATGQVTVRTNNGAGSFALTFGTFTLGSTFPVVRFGDIDGDGDLDIVSANNNGAPFANISVLRNDGVGIFSAATNYPPGGGGGTVTNGIALGDVDKDGDLDIVVTNNGSDNLSVYFNNGVGNFSAPTLIGGVGTTPTSLALGDVNGDGNLDIVVTDIGGTVNVRLNDGLGGFATSVPGAPFVIPAVSNSSDVVVLADIDGDSDLDLAIAHESLGAVTVRINNGSGDFTSASAGSPFGTGAGPFGLACGDLDSDGDVDLVTANLSGASMSVLINASQPRFTCTTGCGPVTYTPNIAPQRNVNSALTASLLTWQFTEPMTTGTFGIASFADMPPPSGKGGPIRIFGSMGASRTVTGGGSGTWAYLAPPVTTATFQPNRAFFSGEQVMVSVTQAQAQSGVPARPYVYGFTAKADTGPGTFYESAFSPHLVGISPFDVALGDVDNDGDVDMVIANQGGNSITIRLNDGTGNYPTQAAGSPLAGIAGVTSVKLADVNNDGRLDLIAMGNTANNVIVRLNSGGGNFTIGAPGSPLTIGFNFPFASAIADFDSDGDLDMAVANDVGGNVIIRLNNGVGDFTLAAPGSPYAIAANTFGIAAGDVDNDGDIDIVASGLAAGAFVLLNDGTGKFTVGPNYAGGTNVAALTLGDVNGDGFLDLVMANQASNDVTIRLNDGTGGFATQAPGSPLPMGTAPRAAVLGDIDGDGDLDLLIANNAPQGVNIRLNNGSGNFVNVGANSPITLGGLTKNIALADVDGDKDLDIVAPQNAGQTVAVLLNRNPDVTTCFGNALQFNGVDSYARVPAATGINVGAGSFTIEAMIRTPVAGGVFLSCGNNGVNGDGFTLQTLGSLGRLEFRWSNFATGVSVRPGVNVQDNQWHHIAVIYRAFPIDSIFIFVDGILSGRGANPNPGVNNITTTALTFGSSFSGAPSSFYAGALDEVRFWNAVVPQQVLNVHKGMPITPAAHPFWANLQSNWRFNEASGSTFTDFKNGQSGTLLTAAIAFPSRILSNAGCSMMADMYAPPQSSIVLPASTQRSGGTASLSYALTGGANLGGTALAPASTATYTAWQNIPQNLTDSFSYTATDGVSISTGTVRVQFTPKLQGFTVYAQVGVPTTLTGAFALYGGITPPVQYTWTGLSGTSFDLTNPAVPVITTLASVNLTLTVQDAYGYAASTTVNVIALGGDALTFSAAQRGLTDGFNGGSASIVSRTSTPFTASVFRSTTLLQPTTASVQWSIAPAFGGTAQFSIQGSSQATLSNAPTFSTSATFFWRNAPPQGGSTQAVITLSTTNGLLIFSTQISVTVIANPAQALVLAMSQQSSTGTQGVNAGAFNQGQLQIANGRLFNVAFGAWNGWGELAATQATVRADIFGSGGETSGFTFTSATVALSGTSTGLLSNLAVSWDSPSSLSTTVTLRLGVITGVFLQSTSVNLTLSVTPLEPVITSFSPTTGATSSIVTVQGFNLGNVSALNVGGIAVQSFTLNSPTLATIVVSTGATGLITATNLAGTGQSLVPFTFVVPPSGLMLSSTQAGVGQTLTISGSNLQNIQSVSIGGTPATQITVTNGQIIVVIPTGAQSGVVSVQTSGGSAVSPPLTIVPSPVISGITPTIISSTGGIVTITGANLTNVTNVTVGGVPVSSFMVISSTQIVAVISNGAVSGFLQVQSPSGISTSPTALTVSTPPIITMVSNLQPNVGTQVFLTGVGFLPGMAVSIGGVPVPLVQVNSPSEAIITLPAEATNGTITVTTPFGTTTFGQSITVVPAPIGPSGIDFSPTSGHSGTVVTITGQGFVGVREVSFGNVPVLSFTTASAERIVAVISTGATGTARVTTTTGTAVSERIFAYLTPLQLDSIRAVAFYTVTDGVRWTKSANWLSGLPLQTWQGLTLQNGRITGIALPNNNVNGSLTSAIVQLAALTALQSLNLSGNALAGVLPSAIGSLRTLRTLNLSGVGLSGAVPQELGNLDSLEVLRLDSNRLEGSVEAVFCTLGGVSTRQRASLKEFRVNNNRLSGVIPPCIVEFTALEIAHLQNNLFTGSIPERVVELTQLRELVLANNRLSGALPRTFDKSAVFVGKAAVTTFFQTLERLDIAQNGFTGALPSGIAQFAALRELRLNDNAFVGALPLTLPALSRLEIFDASRNRFTGGLPDNIGALKRLRQFSVTNNLLSGLLPESLGDCDRLERLELDSNALSGAVPTALSSWLTLKTLGIAQNRITSLPTLIGSRPVLEVLRVASNRLTFESIEGNIGVKNFTYSPQDSVGTSQNLAYRPLNPIDLTMKVGGSANRYQWFKNGVALSAPNASETFVVTESATASDDGLYECRITSALVPGLTLYNRPWVIRIDSAAAVPLQANAVGQPLLIFPPNNTRFVPFSITLRWSAVEGAAQYTVQLATNASFTTVITTATLSATTLTVSALQPSQRYFWRVRSLAQDGARSTWAQALFTTANTERPLQMTSVDFDRVPLRETSIREALVANFSNFPQILNDITILIDSPDDTVSAFRVLDDVRGMVIPAGQSLTLRVSFTPRFVGNTSATSVLSFQQRLQDGARRDSTRNILQGVGGALKMDNIDFDTVRAGGTTIRSAELINLSNMTIRLQRPTIPAQTQEGVFSIESYLGTDEILLRPLDTVQVVVRCRVPEGSIGRKLSGVLVFGDRDSVRASVRAVARALRANDIVVNFGIKPRQDNLPPGSPVDLELTIEPNNSVNLTPSLVSDIFRAVQPQFQAQFRMNRQVLVLDGTEKNATATVSGDVISVKIPPTAWELQRGADSTVLTRVHARVVAGSADNTTLQIERASLAQALIRGSSAVFVEEPRNGTFTARVSKAGGKRLLAPSQQATMSVIARKGTLELTYNIATDGAVDLALYDVVGRKITTLTDRYHVAGEYEATYLTDGLVTGAYFLVLKTANGIAQARVELVQ